MVSPATRLGPYEILAKVGEGGGGEVYRTRDTRLDRIVAIKVLPPAFSQDADRRARFEREARAIAALTHPHICTLHDPIRFDKRDFSFGAVENLMTARTAGWESGNAMTTQYAATRDGKRFLISTAAEPAPISVMLNWKTAARR